jgi:hypothetical protein
MKFTLYEIKLWFIENKTRSFHFKPNKVNVITGDSSTGKTNLWNIIDYCLLSDKVNIASTINKKVSWFGITFSINGKNMSIARRTPENDTASSDIYYANQLKFPANNIERNISIPELRKILDKEFYITDDVKKVFSWKQGRNTASLNYRHFLLFNALTENIIGSQHTYFDTVFFDMKDYEKNIPLIFDLAIGASNLDNHTIRKKIKDISHEITKLKKRQSQNKQDASDYKELITQLFIKLISLGIIENTEYQFSTDEMFNQIQSIINRFTNIPENSISDNELEDLLKKETDIKVQLNTLNKYQNEYKRYVNTLNKYADSLMPIEFLKKNLSDEILYTSETQPFIQLLETSLKDIKNNIEKSEATPIQVEDDIAALKINLEKISKKIADIRKLKEDYRITPDKLLSIGEIKYELEYFIQNKKRGMIIETGKIDELITEKKALEKKAENIEQTKLTLKQNLNHEIQQIYNQITTISSYKGYKIIFDDTNMNIKLQSPEELFPLENVGSKSNYMFMHLCFYLGLHSHIINVEKTYNTNNYVPQFLFIDQPSIPYYAGNDTKIKNNDKENLMNAFLIINDFISKLNKSNVEFQIIMVEHAPKSYWEGNKLNKFHTVDEFINGTGLIPRDVFQKD